MSSVQDDIDAKGLNAPRVTPAEVEAAISAEFYFTAHDGVIGASMAGMFGDFGPPHVVRHNDDPSESRLRLLTICVLILDNGFTVTGESACVSPENFDAEIGRKVARQHAVEKVWPLLGFRKLSSVYVDGDWKITPYAVGAPVVHKAGAQPPSDQ